MNGVVGYEKIGGDLWRTHDNGGENISASARALARRPELKKFAVTPEDKKRLVFVITLNKRRQLKKLDWLSTKKKIIFLLSVPQ